MGERDVNGRIASLAIAACLSGHHFGGFRPGSLRLGAALGAHNARLSPRCGNGMRLIAGAAGSPLMVKRLRAA